MLIESDAITVTAAARRLRVSRARVYRLVERGRLRTRTRAAQGRARGRFAAGGMLLEPADVEREATRRGL